ncbi:hypothetical protein BDR04DRAFT_1093830 [Suillus decipiens]|nr:hypothetical protein BDR04DRAFT_1093830 [Suillus decipiens]
MSLVLHVLCTLVNYVSRLKILVETFLKNTGIIVTLLVTRSLFVLTSHGPLSSYKRKDDLIIIAGALSLSRDGTVIDLTTRIKEHLAENPDCASQPWFAGLLGGK